MQTNSKNKAMNPEATTQKKVSEPYFFAGGGEYEPTSVEATSYDEALKKWEDVRVPVVKALAPLPLQDKDVVE